MYEEVGDAGVVSRRCGISHPTLRKWVKRYQEQGEEGLCCLSRRPLHSPNRKLSINIIFLQKIETMSVNRTL